MGNAFHSAAERKSLAFGLLSCLILAAQAFKQVGHRGWSPNRFLTKSKKGLVSFAVESSTRPPIVYDAANKRISQHSGAFLPLQGESTAFILPGDSSVELTEEFLGMKVVTKKWISYCKSINKSYSGKAYDIQDVITACMKPNTMVHIEDPGDAPVPDTTFISESELVRLFQSKHANEELTEEHYQIALLYEDTKHEFDQQTTEKPYFTMIDQFQSIDVPIEAFYTGKPSNLVDDSAVPSPTARVFEGELHSDTVLFVTQQELERVWDIRSKVKWGLPSDQFNETLALLFLDRADDLEDFDLVDGPRNFTEARDQKYDPYTPWLNRFEDPKIRESLRAQALDLDDQKYLFDHPPLSPISPEVVSQFTSIESFMHSMNPLQRRITANWNDPEKDDWMDSELYTKSATMALPGEPETDYSIQVPSWKRLGFKSGDDIYPTSGRYLEYILGELSEEERSLSIIVDWQLQKRHQLYTPTGLDNINTPLPSLDENGDSKPSVAELSVSNDDESDDDDEEDLESGEVKRAAADLDDQRFLSKDVHTTAFNNEELSTDPMFVVRQLAASSPVLASALKNVEKDLEAALRKRMDSLPDPSDRIIKSAENSEMSDEMQLRLLQEDRENMDYLDYLDYDDEEIRNDPELDIDESFRDKELDGSLQSTETESGIPGSDDELMLPTPAQGRIARRAALIKARDKANMESTSKNGRKTLASLYAELNALKVNKRNAVAAGVYSPDLPMQSIESQELGIENPNGRRISEHEKELATSLDYVPYLDVYYWERHRERWNQGNYRDGKFITPKAWLYRNQYRHMVGFDVWSKASRKLFFDWDDHWLDEDVYAAFSVKALKDITDHYLTDNTRISEEMNDFKAQMRYIRAKLYNSSETFPVKQQIPTYLAPDRDIGVEYSDEVYEMRHGKSLKKKRLPPKLAYENDTFDPATDIFVENMIGTIRESYYWKPWKNLTHEIETEKAVRLEPVSRYINHMAKLVSTKDDIIVYDYLGPLQIVIGVQASMEYLAKQVYPQTKMVRLETERELDSIDKCFK